MVYSVEELTRGSFFSVGDGLPGRQTKLYSDAEWRARVERAFSGNQRIRAERGRAAARTLSERGSAGLSGVPYRAAAVPDANLACEIRPGGVRIRAQTRELRLRTDAQRTVRRGRIVELSDRSRSRLADVARDLGELHRPELLLTLTYPGEWRSVAGDGRAVKRQMKAFRKRLGRFFSALGIDWSALWFLEFQKRGAPHLHLILWGHGLSQVEERTFRSWLARAWVDVVGHADKRQRARHLKAGTAAERMRVGHFGYAVKYARKLEQKTVPSDFGDVGRFWGLWNASRPAPAVLTLPVSLGGLSDVVERLSGVIEGHSLRFAARLRGRFRKFTETGEAFTVSVWGSEAVGALLAGLDGFSPDSVERRA